MIERPETLCDGNKILIWRWEIREINVKYLEILETLKQRTKLLEIYLINTKKLGKFEFKSFKLSQRLKTSEDREEKVI